MRAIAIQENDIKRIRQSLKNIYKSSDLLIHLLNDLITFSRNSYRRKLVIEDGCFRLMDIRTQLMSTFEKQARESKIGLRVLFLPEQASDLPSDTLRPSQSPRNLYVPAGTGSLKDMHL